MLSMAFIMFTMTHAPTYLGSLLGKIHPVLDRVELVHASEAAVGREHLGNHVSNTNTNTNTKTKTKTKCFKDPMYAIFLKIIGFKDFKYDRTWTCLT